MRQAQANFALDMLNLNWSMLDADIALTRAFGRLADAVMQWADGDAMTAELTLKASVHLAEVIASEEQGGDVMLAIQAERFEVLRLLLEMACAEDATNDRQQLLELCGGIRRMLESSLFPPLAGLHHQDMPALHRPLLRILFLVIQAISRLGAPLLDIDATTEAATSFTLQVADAVLDTLVRQPNASWTYYEDLGAIVGVLCEITRAPNAELWLDKVAEHNLVNRSLELVTRTRIENNHVPAHTPSVLLLHLALASSPAFAERLAVSGILPAYSHNAIAVEAELGRIDSPTPTPTPNTTHGAWCGMLLVIKALLSSLPPTSVANLARSEVLPFMRVVSSQVLHTLAWNGEDPISAPTLDELELVTDIFYGVAQAVGPNEGLFEQVQIPLIALLKSIRGALAHPHTLSKSFVPASEEERGALEDELGALEGLSDPDLLFFAARPFIAGRTMRVLGIARSAVLTLVMITSALGVLDTDDEFPDGQALEAEVGVDWNHSVICADESGGGKVLARRSCRHLIRSVLPKRGIVCSAVESGHSKCQRGARSAGPIARVDRGLGSRADHLPTLTHPRRAQVFRRQYGPGRRTKQTDVDGGQRAFAAEVVGRTGGGPVWGFAGRWQQAV
jgi:nuclear pore complex protein Nup188